MISNFLIKEIIFRGRGQGLFAKQGRGMVLKGKQGIQWKSWPDKVG